MAEEIRGNAPDAHTKPFERVWSYFGKLCAGCSPVSFNSADVHVHMYMYARHTY